MTFRFNLSRPARPGSTHGRPRAAVATTAVGLACVVLVGCTAKVKEYTTSVGAQGGTPSANPPEGAKVEDRSPTSPSDVIAAVVPDIQEFWNEKMPEAYNREFEEIPDSRLFPYNEEQLPPPCGPDPVTYLDIENNAFFCSDGEFIAWDEQTLIPDLFKEFGPFAPAMVLAHEWGHAVQFQAGVQQQTVIMEQQADCFAGAWTRRLADGDSSTLTLGAGSLDAALSGMLKFRDEPGTNPNDPAAHGSGFDRVRAFREGFDEGVTKCASYDENPPQVLALPFTQLDYQTGGNAPFDDIIDFTLADLNLYFTSVYESKFTPIDSIRSYSASDDSVSCGDQSVDPGDAPAFFFCPDDNTVVMSADDARELYDSTGDFGVSTMLALQWTVALQLAAGKSQDQIASEDGLRQRLCAVGGWAGVFVQERFEERTIVPGRELVISGGDLDEGLTAVVKYNPPGPSSNKGPGVAFDRIDAMQGGVFDGLQSCGLDL